MSNGFISLMMSRNVFFLPSFNKRMMARAISFSVSLVSICRHLFSQMMRDLLFLSILIPLCAPLGNNFQLPVPENQKKDGGGAPSVKKNGIWIALFFLTIIAVLALLPNEKKKTDN